MNVTCGNCDWQGDDKDIKPLCNVHHLSERLEPGQDTPAGECLKCGAFCYGDMEIPEHELSLDEALSISKGGFRLLGGRLVTWGTMDAILGLLPLLAHKRLGWFPIMGPPSDCEAARREVSSIVAALFASPKETPLALDGPAAGVDQ